MCLAIPMRVVEIDGFQARVEARGIQRVVSLFLMQHEGIAMGDMVVVHMGNAVGKVSVDEARTAWQLYDEMLAAEGGEPGGLVPVKK